MRQSTLPTWRHWSTLMLVAALFFTVSSAQAADTDLVITEIMQNPAVLSDAVGEWFEIHNTGPDPVDIQGWNIADLGTNNYTFPTGTPIVIAAGEYAVVAVDSLTMVGEGVDVLWQYSGFAIANGDDEIILTSDLAVEIDRVEWDGGPVWPDPTGASMQWDEATADNNVGTNWSAPDTPTFGSGDAGTPNLMNQVGGGTAPNIQNVLVRPLVVEPATAPTISADVTDDGTIVSVNLYVQINGGGFVPQAMSAGAGDSYSATVAAQALGTQVDYYVEATDDEPLTSTNPSAAPASFYSYTVQNKVITPIASIHADSLTYAGTLVTVQAQVYGPGDYKADGTTVSAYIQDGSNRGINVFGTFLSTGATLLNDTSNIVEVSGEVAWFGGTTVELLNYEVTLISSGNPDLTPFVYNTATAALPSNEGTFIKSTGPITAIATTGGTNPAHNFTVNDGSGPLVIRVDDDLNPNLATWQIGDVLEASGAGATFGGQGQILVMRSSQLTNFGPSSLDVVSAVLTGPTEVTVVFNQDVDATTGSNPANYQVFETLIPGNTIAVNTATVQVDASQVVLALGAAPSVSLLYTLRINNVENLGGDPIAPDTDINILNPSATVNLKINEVMQNPFALPDSDGEWFEVYNAGAGPVDMNGWTIRDNGIDSHVINNGGSLIINPGEYKVFTRNATAMAGEGVTSFYQYGVDITLGNSDDELYLVNTSAAIVDSVLWDGGLVWPDPSGASMQWDGTGDNNDGLNWYFQGFAFGSGDLGSPGAVNVEDTVTDVPGMIAATRLGANVPNPFNPRTSFNFTLARDDRVSLKVFDLRGRHVRTVLDDQLKAGSYDGVYTWDGRSDSGSQVPSGTYFFRLVTESGFKDAKKMTLLK